MLKDLIAKADKEGFKLAPFIGITCPGVIKSDGSIEKGAQNLPGNWESSKFNLPASLAEAIPQIGEHDTALVMHNCGARTFRNPLYARRETLGRADDRYWPR
jgi:hypothetical protein